MSVESEYDVAVIGGGPAGTTAAKTVRDYSDEMRVVLLDEGTERADRGDRIGPDSTDAAGQLKYWLDGMPDWVADIFLRNKVSAVRRAEFHGPNDSAVVREGNRFEEFIVNSVPTGGTDVDLDSFGMTFDRPGLDDDLVAAARAAGTGGSEKRDPARGQTARRRTDHATRASEPTEPGISPKNHRTFVHRLC